MLLAVAGAAVGGAYLGAHLTTPEQSSTTAAAALAQTVAPAPIDLPCMQTSHGCIALNPDVAQDSIGQTICVTGYTATIRPSPTYTNGVKAKLLREAGLDASHMADYQLDHVIPLAVGGHPRKLSNLQLQPWQGEDSAYEKDGLERRLQNMVCLGEVTLVDAQFCIAENWQACKAELATGNVLSGGKVVTGAEPSTEPDAPSME